MTELKLESEAHHVAWENAEQKAEQARLEATAYEVALDNAMQEIKSLQAKLAQQAEALNRIAFSKEPWSLLDLHILIKATQADVDNWMQGKKAEWEKGVVEDMCSKCTLIAGG